MNFLSLSMGLSVTSFARKRSVLLSMTTSVFFHEFLEIFLRRLGKQTHTGSTEESSSEPNPVYGGIGFSAFGGGGALYGTGVKSSIPYFVL